jgi:hypothetical protein
MNNYITCSLLNIEYKIDTDVYLLKNNDKIGTKYKMIFVPNPNLLSKSNNLINIQFNIYTTFVKSIDFKIKNKIKKITNINQDGFLISFDFSYDNDDNKIEIIFYPINNEAKIFIKDKSINMYKTDKLVQIDWDNIFIINLERRSDRKNDMIKKLKTHNINKYEFINAIDGIEPHIIEKYNELKNNKKTQIISSGHFACLLSHIKAIEEAKSRGYSNIMILEDDVVLCDNFINELKKINVPCHDMVYLGGIINKKKVFFSHWAKSNLILGAYGYILSSNLFDYVFGELKKMTDYVDLFYIKNVQLNYRVILLDDMVKTNLDSTDTSGKSLMMTRRLSYIKH